MKEKKYKSYEELPLFLSVQELSEVLGVSRTVAYELVRQNDFPSITIGNRIIVPKEKLIAWIDRESTKK